MMQHSNVDLMEKMPVRRAILKLAIPTVLSSIVSLLYNLTDTYFIGMLDDPIQLGAISLGFPVFMVVQAIGNIFGNGAPSYISRCLGAYKYDEVKRTSSVSAYVAVICTLVMTALYFLLRSPLLSLLGADEITIAPTRDYLDIIVGFAFILTLQVVLPSFLRAEGKSKQSMIGVFIGTIINIILDPFFILGLNMGVAGAAWATIIGNICAVVYYLILYFRGDNVVSIRLKDFRPSKRILSEVLKIGLPSSISQIIMSFSNILMNNLSQAHGPYVVPAYGIAGKMINIAFMILMGYASGYVPLAGYNFGAKNIKRAVSAFKFTILSSTGICLVFLVPFMFFPEAFIRAFSSNEEIIGIGTRLIRTWACFLPFLGVQMTIMCTFQAAGKAINALIVNLGRQCIFFIPLMLILDRQFGLNGLIAAQPAADFLTTITAVLLGINMFRELRKLNKFI